MKATFELELFGGAAERRYRRDNPGVDELPWESLDARDYPPELVAAARASWTQGAFSEYTTAAAFSELLRALLEARAPIDLVGMAGRFVADEVVHTELNARMAMQLGGAVVYEVDFGALTPRVESRDARMRAAELAVRYCCVGESLSVPLLVGTCRAAAHPLTRAVLERIVRDARSATSRPGRSRATPLSSRRVRAPTSSASWAGSAGWTPAATRRCVATA
jgi:hypothetical protein